MVLTLRVHEEGFFSGYLDTLLVVKSGRGLVMCIPGEF